MATEHEIKSFKDLIVWQKAIELCVEIYRTTRTFPTEERFGMIAELRKTARSIADYLRFLGIAAGSGGELETQILLAERLAYFPPEQARDLLERYRDVERMLAGLTRSLDKR